MQNDATLAVQSSSLKLGTWALLAKAGWASLVLVAGLSLSCSDKAKEGAVDPCDTGKIRCGDPCSDEEPCPTRTYCNGSGICTADCLGRKDTRCGEGNVCYEGSGQCMPENSVDLSDTEAKTEQERQEEANAAKQGGSVALTTEQADQLRSAACAGESRELEQVPAAIEFVIDTSYSMAERQVQGITWNLQGNGPTKWEITRDALKAAIDNLSSATAVGIVFYPNHAIYNGNPVITEPQDISFCFNPSTAVAMAPLAGPDSAQRQAINAAIDAVSPNGNTPTHDAYLWALNNGLGAVNGYSGSRYMLLLTDGVPTFAQFCVGSGQETPPPVPTQPIVDEIAGAFTQDQTKTFIIGAPGSQDGVEGADARPWLSQAARAGNTADIIANCSDGQEPYCHMDMTQGTDFASALRDGLGYVTDQVSGCTFNIPNPPNGQVPDFEKIQVILSSNGGEELILPDAEGECTEGWQLIDNQVVLCGASCDKLKGDLNAIIQVIIGCTIDQIDLPLE